MDHVGSGTGVAASSTLLFERGGMGTAQINGTLYNSIRRVKRKMSSHRGVILHAWVVLSPVGEVCSQLYSALHRKEATRATPEQGTAHSTTGDLGLQGPGARQDDNCCCAFR